MKIPCAKPLPFVIYGLSFLNTIVTNIQYQNLTLIATALILGSKFNLTEISYMWLKEKSVSTFSEFLSDAKISTHEMQQLYLLRTLQLYKIRSGYFLIDDTMLHHTKFCKWIHGVSILFDHALGTNLKAHCIVFLYYSDGKHKKFVIDFRIYYKEEDKMPWNRGTKYVHKKKYDLAVEMMEDAINKGFPACTVLADSWFGIEPFVKELKRLKLSYILEITTKNKVKVTPDKPKLTPTGKIAKKQYVLKSFKEYFKSFLNCQICGFAANEETGKQEKALYYTKISTVRLNAIPEKQRLVESFDPIKKTTKYLITNELTWESTKIISTYNYRWVIEEFFRNAKQLTDMEGATIRSEQGVTLALYLVSWIDFLLHHENYKQSISGELTKESLTIPSIVRQLQYENLLEVLSRVQNEKEFVAKWLDVTRKKIYRNRKKHKELVLLNENNNKQGKKVVPMQQ
jgi:hypothetical protein